MSLNDQDITRFSEIYKAIEGIDILTLPYIDLYIEQYFKHLTETFFIERNIVQTPELFSVVFNTGFDVIRESPVQFENVVQQLKVNLSMDIWALSLEY